MRADLLHLRNVQSEKASIALSPSFRCTQNGDVIEVNSAFLFLLGIKTKLDTLEQINIANYPPFVLSGISKSITDCFRINKSLKKKCLFSNEAGRSYKMEYCVKPEYTHVDDKKTCAVVLTEFYPVVRESEKDRVVSQTFHLFNHCVDAIRVTDARGIIQYVNDAFCTLVDLKKDELEGRDISVLYNKSEYQPKSVLHRYKENFDSRDLPALREASIKLKSGRHLVVEVSDTFINSTVDNPLLMSIFRDITLRKRIEEESKRLIEDLQQSVLMKDRFFSLVAHDLKSPFQSILGYSSILCDEFADLETEEVYSLLKKQHMLNKNVYRLVENLLEWSRLQTGKIQFNPEALKLKNTIQEIVKLLHPMMQAKDITLRVKAPAKLEAYADSKMFVSILENLISNAIKFTPANGKISIDAKQVKNRIKISVSDSGIGILKEDLPKLFVIDKHFSSPGTNNEKGTGLGLLLVKEMIEQHGGVISVLSTPGKGSTFSFTIPCNW